LWFVICFSPFLEATRDGSANPTGASVYHGGPVIE
jgi:hypothetical protein